MQQLVPTKTMHWGIEEQFESESWGCEVLNASATKAKDNQQLNNYCDTNLKLSTIQTNITRV